MPRPPVLVIQLLLFLYYFPCDDEYPLKVFIVSPLYSMKNAIFVLRRIVEQAIERQEGYVCNIYMTKHTLHCKRTTTCITDKTKSGP